jgi:hypothetical protein
MTSWPSYPRLFSCTNSWRLTPTSIILEMMGSLSNVWISLKQSAHGSMTSLWSMLAAFKNRHGDIEPLAVKRVHPRAYGGIVL